MLITFPLDLIHEKDIGIHSGNCMPHEADQMQVWYQFEKGSKSLFGNPPPMIQLN
jgi:hypothetical protein